LSADGGRRYDVGTSWRGNRRAGRPAEVSNGTRQANVERQMTTKRAANAKQGPLVELSVFALLVAVAVLMRLASNHWGLWNFAPVTAAALYAGYFFGYRGVALLVPLAVMVLSNLALDRPYGHVGLLLVTYAALALPVIWRGVLRKHCGPLPVAGCAAGSAVLFFLITNGAVWALGFSPHGLLGCYLDGVPFFRATLLSDLLWAGIFFGTDALVRRSASLPLAEARVPLQ